MDASTLAVHPLAISLPIELIQRIRQFEQKGLTGQVIINYNAGDPQSFEIKEHCRVRKI
jgi:hypothetical protein